MSWSDDKELSSGADAIGWNSLKKKILSTYLGYYRRPNESWRMKLKKKMKTIETKIKTCQT